MGQITIMPETTTMPITLIGRMAGLCYGSDVLDDSKNYKRGLACINDGHGRTLEFPDVYMSINGYSARVIREFYTHIGGAPTRLQSSTRYIDYNNFDYVIPPKIANNSDALRWYKDTMFAIQYGLTQLELYGISKEDAGMLLPLGMTTDISVKFNARTLSSMAEQRLCTRAYWEYRNELMPDIINALKNYSEEWNTLCDSIMICKCDKTGYCLEHNSCGRRPRKDIDSN